MFMKRLTLLLVILGAVDAAAQVPPFGKPFPLTATRAAPAAIT